MARKKDDTLNKRIGERLTNLLIEKYGVHGESPKIKDFVIDLDIENGRNPLGPKHYITKSSVSKICKGETTLSPDNAVSFSKVLDVPLDYLMCKTDYRNVDEEAHAIWSKNKTDRIDRLISFTSLLDCLGYTVEYILSDKHPSDDPVTFYTCSETLDGFQINGVKSHSIKYDAFYDMLKDNRFSIKIEKRKWLYLYSIRIFRANHVCEDLDISSFFRTMNTTIESVRGIIDAQLRFNDLKSIDLFEKDCLSVYEDPEGVDHIIRD